MKLGVFTALYGNLSFDEALAKLKALGVEAIEIPAGGYPGKAHCDPEVLLADRDAFAKFVATIEKYGMEVSALSVHGNPVHPDKAVAKAFDDDFRRCVLLAEKLGIDTVITFSGCPGDSENSKYPNWVTCPWPDDYLKILDWQWNEVLIPYWKEAVAFANAHGVTKIALEMHPGFCVYNPETLLKLRAAVGSTIGANLDPSHLIWQGIDPVLAIRKLGDAIYHFHAKDTKVDPYNSATDGVLDTKHYSDELHRAWVFRSVGYGHDLQFWRDIVSNLRLVGYDKVMSIEHEDSLMSIDEGLSKAVACLREAIMSDPKPSSMHWA
ncbi:MAG TPA: sugar phosphate isomerase/epimerase [Bacillota bacterium]|nr:sugar phosphate isomerase/epimerase [Clostridiales bacterium]HPT84382.1 sugar phosphate isomerase/epimerase [Bacillota bacterium]